MGEFATEGALLIYTCRTISSQLHAANNQLLSIPGKVVVIPEKVYMEKYNTLLVKIHQL